MSRYDKLDLMIFEAIKAGACSFDAIESTDAGVEAKRLYAENPSGKTSYRHIDSRLQAIKRKGLIEFKRPIGWRVV